jgi:hypothetical protein
MWASQAPYSCFGISMAVRGNWAVIGAESDDGTVPDSGSAYVFEYNGNQWYQTQKLVASDDGPNDGFGHAVGMFNGIVIGAPYDDDNGQNSGSAYVFGRQGDYWVQRAKLWAGDGQPGDYFGYSVTVSANGKVLVGAPMSDDQGGNAGSAYAFVWDDSGTPDDPSDDLWVQQPKMRASDGQPGDYFGHSVAIWGNSGLMGAHNHEEFGPGSGVAYEFAVGLDDCNGNAIPDACDIGSGTSADVDGNGIPDECDSPGDGDIDGDGDVDLDDYSAFARCLGGPEVLTPPGDCMWWEFDQADMDRDYDVDLVDFAGFIAAFTR